MERKFSYFLLNLQYTIVFHSFVLLITPEKIYIYRGTVYMLHQFH